MQWIDNKFWIHLSVFFPPSAFVGTQDPDFLDFEVGPQDGPQMGPQTDCGPEEETIEVCFDLLSFTSEFELNAIPTATVSVAIGRRADDVSKVAKIHYYVDKLQTQLKAKVWCQAMSPQSSSGAPDPPRWPSERFLIFDGYLTGSGFKRSQNGAELNLAITHWLTDLNFSSCLSRQSHPLNPAQLFFPANFVLSEELAGGSFIVGGSAGALATGPSMAMFFFADSEIIQNDFWGGIEDAFDELIPSGLKDWLLYLTKLDRINAAEIVTGSGGAASVFKPQINYEACRALKRFEPNAEYNGTVEVGYRLGVPLGLDENNDLNEFVANSIGVTMGSETLEAYNNVTLWDKLAGQFHADYMYSVVPLVEKALVVPFVPGLAVIDDEAMNSDVMVHRVIRTSQYESIDLSAAMPRPLRAVGLIVGKNFVAGSGLTNDTQLPYTTFGGYFDRMLVDPEYGEGLIMFKNTPRWMSNFIPNYMYTNRSTGNEGDIQASTAPGAGSPADIATPAEIFSAAKSTWDLYARTLYIHEILKGRQGTITGPVRFDIAPGSQIKVEATEDVFVKEIVHAPPGGPQQCHDEFFTFFYCSVLRVSTTIDCQNAKAFTSFYVGHVRSEEEQNNEGTSIDAHPVWSRCTWGGCVLVQDPAFNMNATRECPNG